MKSERLTSTSVFAGNSARLLLFAVLWVLCFSVFNVEAQLFTEQASLYGLDIDGEKDGGFSFGDLNEDGFLDVIVNTLEDDAAHRTRVLFSEGALSSGFVDVTDLNCKGCNRTVSPSATTERCLIIADFNGDGLPDFVRNSARRLEIYFNKGAAPVDGNPPYSFGDVDQLPDFELYTNTISDPSPNFGIPGGMNTEGVGVFDYDSDGDLDIYIENHNWGMDIYENTGYATGIFIHATPDGASLGLPISATDGDYAAITDVNDDGFVDALARKRDQLDFYLNNGGTFSAISFDQQASNNNKGAVAFHDFDGDGDFDLVWTENELNRIWIQTGVNSGNFSPTSEPWASAGLTDPAGLSSQHIDGLACGDIDNDGDVDIFFGDDSLNSYLFINQTVETGLFGFIRDNLGINVGADAEGASFVDLDYDGDQDLYININNGPNQLWINNLDSTAAGPRYLNVIVLENRNAALVNTLIDRNALGATIQLFDCNGTALSGIKEVNGGYGHGNQESRRVHFGLPLGEGSEDQDYFVEVKYPNLSGTRTIIQRPVTPSELVG
ncbi:MAG: hypothetical protein ACI959_001222, partial [Limisphaerales bacterium]